MSYKSGENLESGDPCDDIAYGGVEPSDIFIRPTHGWQFEHQGKVPEAHIETFPYGDDTQNDIFFGI